MDDFPLAALLVEDSGDPRRRVIAVGKEGGRGVRGEADGALLVARGIVPGLKGDAERDDLRRVSVEPRLSIPRTRPGFGAYQRHAGTAGDHARERVGVSAREAFVEAQKPTADRIGPLHAIDPTARRATSSRCWC